MKEPRRVKVRISLDPPLCRIGYPETQLEDILTPLQFSNFIVWMSGQTYSSCTGEEYDYDLKKNVPTGCGPHGYVYYRGDVDRFLRGLPVVD